MKLLNVLALGLFVAAATAEMKSYKGYQAYQIFIEDRGQAKAISDLQGMHLVTVMNEIRLKGPTDIMLKPSMTSFVSILDELNIRYEKVTGNVQDLIDAEAATLAEIRKSKGGVSGPMDWLDYHTLDEMYDYFDVLEANNEGVSSDLIGQSTEGRMQRVLKVCKGGACGTKPALFIEGGIHAREWISPAAVMYMADQVARMDASNPLVAGLEWYFLPSTNPDGYAWTWDSDRLWRKTRSPQAGGCIGTDGNRNWDFRWNTGGTSDDPCSETYHGPTPFSEPETQNVATYIETIADLRFFHDCHSYSQYVLLPYGDGDYPGNYNDQLSVAEEAENALQAVHGESYEVGNIAEVIYVATGGAIDYAVGALGVPMGVSMELRPTNQFEGGFQLPADQIIPCSEEVWAFHQVVAQSILDGFGEP